MSETNPFAEWLCKERARRGVQRSVMASMLALNQTTLREYETGCYVAKIELFEKMQSILGPAPEEVVEWMRFRALGPNKRQRHSQSRSPFAIWLRNGRKNLNLKQSEFALKVGLGRDGLGRIERGERFVSEGVLKAIEDLIGQMPSNVKAWTDERYRQNLISRTSNAHDDDSPFGRLLRAERHRLNMTRRDLAQKIGVSFVQIQRFEEGTRSVNNEVLQKLAAVCGHETVPTEWKDALIEGDQTPRARSSFSVDKLPPLGQAMRKLRLEQGATLEAIAQKMGIGPAALGAYELGRINISDIRLKELAVAYGAPEAIDEWFELRHRSKQDPQSNNGAFNEGLTHFGMLLRSVRQERDVTQKALSEALGKEAKFICCLEYGMIAINMDILRGIVDYMGLPDMLPAFIEAVDRDGNWTVVPGLEDSQLSERGRQAREARRAMGLSQAELAEAQGVSLAVINQRETERVSWKIKKREWGE